MIFRCFSWSLWLTASLCLHLLFRFLLTFVSGIGMLAWKVVEFLKSAKILSMWYCNKRKRLKTQVAASCACCHWKECCSRKGDTRCKSPFWIWRDRPSMGAVVAWAGAARCARASSSSGLVTGGAVSEQGGPQQRLNCQAGVCFIVMFAFNCSAIGKDCVWCPQTFPEEECQPGPWFWFFLCNCPALVWEETVLWTLEETSCVWFTTDDLTSFIAQAWSYTKRVNCGVLKAQWVMILHSNCVYRRVS